MEKAIKRSQIMYICEAAFEYLISILVASSFLATLTKEIGINDSVTGIISSFISLGCIFQMLSIFVKGKSVKSFVVVLSILNQLLFMFLYVIPIAPLKGKIKTVVFVAVIFIAYFIYNFAHPKKINWFMSLIDEGSRGRFTAVKEMVSLIAGMAFSYIMGYVIDYYKGIGQMRTAFIISGLVIFVLMILHTLTMLFSIEKETNRITNENIFKQMILLFKDKTVLKVALVFVFWNIANYCAIPFYGTYQINELGFSLKFISVMAILGSAVRVAASFLLGAYADKKGFAYMLRVCFAVMCLGFIAVAFAVPSNAKPLFIVYNLFSGFAMAGINSALINLIYDYVVPEKRADSLALSQALAGIFGFGSTLIMSWVVSYIQKHGNKIFGFNMYAQQFASILAFVFTIVAMIYIIIALPNQLKNKK